MKHGICWSSCWQLMPKQNYTSYLPWTTVATCFLSFSLSFCTDDSIEAFVGCWVEGMGRLSRGLVRLFYHFLVCLFSLSLFSVYWTTTKWRRFTIIRLKSSLRPSPSFLLSVFSFFHGASWRLPAVASKFEVYDTKRNLCQERTPCPLIIFVEFFCWLEFEVFEFWIVWHINRNERYSTVCFRLLFTRSRNNHVTILWEGITYTRYGTRLHHLREVVVAFRCFCLHFFTCGKNKLYLNTRSIFLLLVITSNAQQTNLFSGSKKRFVHFEPSSLYCTSSEELECTMKESFSKFVVSLGNENVKLQ